MPDSKTGNRPSSLNVLLAQEKEDKEKLKFQNRDKSPELDDDQLSGCCSSAMCGLEFPENGKGQIISSANLMFAINDTDTVSLDHKLEENLP